MELQYLLEYKSLEQITYKCEKPRPGLWKILSNQNALTASYPAFKSLKAFKSTLVLQDILPIGFL